MSGAAVIPVTVTPVAEAAAWRAVLAGFAEADVYHDPAYVAAIAGGGRAELWSLADGDDALAVAIVRRPLPAWLEESGHDAEIPNGYGAPLADGAGARLWPRLAEELGRHGIVNCFLRLHPFIPHHVDPAWCIGLPHPTVWIPLDAGAAGAFAGGRCATHRSQVSRAERLGHTVRCAAAPEAAALAGFRALYAATMERLAAAADYRFDDAYFAALAGLGARLALVEVHDAAGTLVNAALLLRGTQWCHYHLSARRDDAHNSSGHLLFTAAAAWAAGHGCRGIHLGGGTSGAADDPLLAYKRRIGRGDAEFRTAGVVTDPMRHAQLRERWARRAGRAPRWFQAYREPLVTPA